MDVGSVPKRREREGAGFTASLRDNLTIHPQPWSPTVLMPHQSRYNPALFYLFEPQARGKSPCLTIKIPQVLPSLMQKNRM
jgi:hypothetical protein